MEGKLKILLIDDDVELREMYTEIFQNADFEVFEANNGVQGLEIATAKLPDVIFTGIKMPGMDGFTLIETLKKNAATADIPVVISSHMGREEDHKRAIALGAKDFIVRGTTRPIEVLERIRSLFTRSGNEYMIAFSPDESDAPKLAKEMSFQPNFQCLDCRGKLALKLKLTDPKNRMFEAQFVCPKCGLAAK